MFARITSGAILCLCALCVGSVVQKADAAMLVSDDRVLTASLDFSEDGAPSFVGPITDFPTFGADYDDMVATGDSSSDPNGDVDGDATATQTATFDSAPFSVITASGSADISLVVRSFSGTNDGSAEAESIFDILFTVDSPQTWSLSATVDDAGSGRVGRVRLRPEGEADMFNLSTSSGMASDSADVDLVPGTTYQLLAEATANGFVTSAGSTVSNRDASFSLEFRAVPEPASGLLLLLGGLVGLRRRD
ncbi:MAG: PEP-CTERM sorting domain-containing protein [Phycisphaerales bacterium]|nr:PEP-CTERM sorting domain-containing protein [Phycisphaerales bacterium]